MRISLATTGLTLLLLAGCGAAKTDSGPSSETGGDSASSSEASAPADGSVPRVDPGNAPNVAFGYRYSFGLSADQIAPVQQGHARLCEELGRERCQITGMEFRRRGDRDAQAELNLALDPAIAHRFGEQALAKVREAEGTLVDSQVTGTQVRPDANSGALQDLEQQLAALQQRIEGNRNPADLSALQAEAANLRERIRDLTSDQSDTRRRVATTAVALTYSSSAFATGNPDFGGAMSGAWSQLKWIAYGLFSLAMLIGPWVLAAALFWFAAGRLRRARPAEAA